MVPPAPTGRVNDYAGLLTPAERDRLEARLAERERATGAQMVIALFRSLEGESLEDYSIRLAERWRIGQKGLDNGVILVVFVNDRKLRLEVGYGLEAVLPDAVAGGIIRDAVAPRFREGRYGPGLEAAVDAVFARIETRGRAPARPGAPSATLWSLGVLVLFAVVAVILLSEAWSGRRFTRRGGIVGGRRGGGWYDPPIVVFPGGRSGGGFGGGASGGGFSGGGGSFGGGGASGNW